MVDFDLTQEQQLLEQSVREWGAREVAPRIRELDRQHRFDPGILPQMAELGLLGCSVPVEYGGAGMDYISLGIVSEELEYVDTSLRVIISVHAGLNCLTLLAWGSDDQKTRYLVPQAQGKQIATYGLTEPAAGSDVRGIQTVAIKRGDRLLLTGEKMWISLADVADNFLVFAWTDLEKKNAAGYVRNKRIHRRANLQGLLERHAEGKVGNPRRQHRVLQDGRSRSSRGESGRPTRARDSKSRCSRSIKGAIRSPQARPV